MSENIEIINFYYDDTDLDEIGDLYCRTFLEEQFSLEDKEKVVENIKKHANYEGFKGLKAKNSEGDIVGFTYGYTSLPGQFYRKKIAEQLSGIEINTWLKNSFEFVELAVCASYKRLGIAGNLHDTLLEKNNHKTSVLTTGIENSPAINLYRKKGWQLVKSNAPVISDEHLQMIMGKRIN